MIKLCYQCENFKNEKLIAKCVDCFRTRLYPIDSNGCYLCTKPHQWFDEYCYSCQRDFIQGDFRLDDLIPISYNTGKDLLTSYLVSFKNNRHNDRLMGIVSVLIEFLRLNHKKISSRHGSIDYITNVPGLNDRNHNEIIMHVSKEHLPFPYIKALMQVRRMPKHQGADRSARILNKNAFQISPGIDINKKSILLFDDLFTTGSTLCSAAHTLYENGAEQVIGLVLVRRISGEYELARANEIREEQGFDFRICKYDLY